MTFDPWPRLWKLVHLTPVQSTSRDDSFLSDPRFVVEPGSQHEDYDRPPPPLPPPPRRPRLPSPRNVRVVTGRRRHLEESLQRNESIRRFN